MAGLDEVLDRLRELANEEAYIEFIRKIARGALYVEERDTWLEWFGGNRKRLEETLVAIAKILYRKHMTVTYPLELIVVPRYPFTKQPIVPWAELARADPSDTIVIKTREVAGKLGTLINAGFVLRNFVMIDIDEISPTLAERVKDMLHIKTRRGYHIYYYVKDAPAVGLSMGDAPSAKRLIECNGVKIEFASGPGFLGSIPFQSRYLEFDGRRVNVRRYKYVSKEAEYAWEGRELSLITRSIEEVEEAIKKLLTSLGCEAEAARVRLEAYNDEKAASMVKVTVPNGNKFHQAGLGASGVLTYDEFKQLIAKNRALAPACLYAALFENIPKGYRWFHLRLLAAVLPYFVHLDESELVKIIDDFARRTGSTAGETRKWMYDMLYFTGRQSLGDFEIVTASALGVPREAWDAYRELGWCNKCVLKEQCQALKSGAKRRWLIIKHVEKLIERGVSEQ